MDGLISTRGTSESTREEIILEHNFFHGQDLVTGFMWGGGERQ